MNIWGVLGLWLGAWISIIILHATVVKMYNSDSLKHETFDSELGYYPLSESEMVKDGNNLFATGIAYFGANVLCYFINNSILSWGCVVLGLLFCVPSIISIKRMLAQMVNDKNKYITFMTISSLINALIPVAMAINIYFLDIA